MAKIKKGDNVIILSGKDKGAKGEVLKVIPHKNRAIVADTNVAKRHTRQTQQDAGGIVKKELSIHLSNIAIEDPKTGKASRVGYKALEDGKKVRVAKKSGEVIA